MCLTHGRLQLMSEKRANSFKTISSHCDIIGFGCIRVDMLASDMALWDCMALDKPDAVLN